MERRNEAVLEDMVKRGYHGSKNGLVGIFEKEYKFSKQAIDAFKKIKREDFVLKEYKHRAYDDNALPIISGQTISQPSTILFMLDWLELQEGQKVLEIGAGSGYNAALIATIIGNKGKVYSVEIDDELYKLASDNIKKAGIKNAEIIKADGSLGYKKAAEYDRIIATAASPDILDSWIKQLKDGGIIIAPVGYNVQNMVKVKKKGENIIRFETGEYLFVPLRGKKGFTHTSI